MKLRNVLLLPVLALFLVVSSCDKPACKSTNPVFDSHLPASEEYKLELIKQMAKSPDKKFSYWVDDYLEENGKEYLVVDIQGESICAKIVMQVKDWGKAAGIQRTMGDGYRGAELAGLTFTIEADSLGTQFVYQDIDRIID